MPIGHDPAHVLALLGPVAEPLLEQGAELGDELGLGGLGAEHVVRGDARLAEVDDLAPQETLGGHGQLERKVRDSISGEK